MRHLIAFLVVVGLAAAGATPVPAVAADSASVLADAQQPGGGGIPDIDITVTEGGAESWANPVWIGVGIVALILLIVIVALATRGGGTTIIKD